MIVRCGDYTIICRDIGIVIPDRGYCAPYAYAPTDGFPLGEDVYLNMIQSAAESIYITTPYLIITDEMSRALCLAAKRGVDVRIVLPGIPDKTFVYAVSRSLLSPTSSGRSQNL